MKALIITLGLGLFLSAGVMAQSNPDFGPSRKNQKPWNKTAVVKEVVVLEKQKPVFGPVAKNAKVQASVQSGDKVVPVSDAEAKPVLGPAYKNRKPWE
jgi:hypothetical protein